MMRPTLRRKPVPTLEVSTRSNRAMLLRVMSDDPDRPSTTTSLQDTLPGMARGTMARELSALVDIGAIERVRFGAYVRLVGEVGA